MRTETKKLWSQNPASVNILKHCLAEFYVNITNEINSQAITANLLYLHIKCNDNWRYGHFGIAIFVVIRLRNKSFSSSFGATQNSSHSKYIYKKKVLLNNSNHSQNVDTGVLFQLNMNLLCAVRDRKSQTKLKRRIVFI